MATIDLRSKGAPRDRPGPLAKYALPTGDTLVARDYRPSSRSLGLSIFVLTNHDLTVNVYRRTTGDLHQVFAAAASTSETPLNLPWNFADGDVGVELVNASGSTAAIKVRVGESRSP